MRGAGELERQRDAGSAGADDDQVGLELLARIQAVQVREHQPRSAEMDQRQGLGFRPRQHPAIDQHRVVAREILLRELGDGDAQLRDPGRSSVTQPS